MTLDELVAPITMQDVRLFAGEGKFDAAAVLAAVNVVLRRRSDAAQMEIDWVISKWNEIKPKSEKQHEAG